MPAFLAPLLIAAGTQALGSFMKHRSDKSQAQADYQQQMQQAGREMESYSLQMAQIRKYLDDNPNVKALASPEYLARVYGSGGAAPRPASGGFEDYYKSRGGGSGLGAAIAGALGGAAQAGQTFMNNRTIGSGSVQGPVKGASMVPGESSPWVQTWR